MSRKYLKLASVTRLVSRAHQSHLPEESNSDQILLERVSSFRIFKVWRDETCSCSSFIYWITKSSLELNRLFLYFLTPGPGTPPIPQPAGVGGTPLVGGPPRSGGDPLLGGTWGAPQEGDPWARGQAFFYFYSVILVHIRSFSLTRGIYNPQRLRH